MSEWRKEICSDCLADREREWVVKVIPKGSPIPKGYRVQRRGATWNTIEGRTKWATLCECDV